MSDEVESSPIAAPLGTDGEPMVDPEEAQLPAGLAPTSMERHSHPTPSAPPATPPRPSKQIDEAVLLARSMVSAGIKAGLSSLLDSMEPGNMVKRLSQLEALAEQAQGPLSVLGKDQIFSEPIEAENTEDPRLENMRRWSKLPVKVQSRIKRLIMRSGQSPNDIMFGEAPAQLTRPKSPTHNHPPGSLEAHNANLQEALQEAAGINPLTGQPLAGGNPYSGGNPGLFSLPYEDSDLEDDLEDLDDQQVGTLMMDTFRRKPERRETAGVRAMEDIVAAIGSIAGNRNLAADLQSYNEAKKAGFDDLAETIKNRIYASEGASLDVQRTADAIAQVSTRSDTTPDEQEGYRRTAIRVETDEVIDDIADAIDEILDGTTESTICTIDESGGMADSQQEF